MPRAPYGGRPYPGPRYYAPGYGRYYSRGYYYPRYYYPYYYPRYYYPSFYSSFYYPGFYYPGFNFSFGIGFGYGYGGYPYYGYGGYPGYYGYGGGYYGGYPYAPYWDGSSEVRIQVMPRDAEVYVDGRFAGHVDDFDGTFQRLRVEPGGHEITVYHERYQPIVEKRYFSPSSGYKIEHAMVPLAPGDAAPARPAPSQQPAYPGRPRGRADYEDPDRGGSAPSSRFGMLSIRVQPADAEVLVDGERWRFPETGERLELELTEGPHRVEIRKEGHEPYVTTVTIRAGEAATLNVSLTRGPRGAALRTSSRRG